MFGPEQQAAFAELKRRLTQAETLGYFDRTVQRRRLLLMQAQWVWGQSWFKSTKERTG